MRPNGQIESDEKKSPFFAIRDLRKKRQNIERINKKDQKMIQHFLEFARIDDSTKQILVLIRTWVYLKIAAKNEYNIVLWNKRICSGALFHLFLFFNFISIFSMNDMEKVFIQQQLLQIWRYVSSTERMFSNNKIIYENGIDGLTRWSKIWSLRSDLDVQLFVSHFRFEKKSLKNISNHLQQSLLLSHLVRLSVRMSVCLSLSLSPTV